MTNRLPSLTCGLLLIAVLGVPGRLLAHGPLSPAPLASSAAPTPPWDQILQLFDEWAAVQQLYSPAQASQWRAQIMSKAAALPPADAQRLAVDLNAKLHVMLGAEAREARKWLSETLAVASDSYAKQVKAGLPDPRNMTAAQLQARLDEFEGREANMKQFEAGLQSTRQMQVKAIEAGERSQAAANAAAWQGGGGYSGSAYNPGANQRSYGRYYPPAGRPLMSISGLIW
jgi:hypothetical protein